MQIHDMISDSGVNGPGRRAVVWFQGCTLACPGCWNPKTHVFDPRPQRSVEDVGSWILSCPKIDGVTFSGGEPFQQAPDLLGLCEYLKTHDPGLSIGLFSGYTIAELTGGRWKYRSPGDEHWRQGSNGLFNRITGYLDFGVFGRFSRMQATSDKPLCGSCNQQVIFFSDRYSEQDLAPQGCELNISADGNEMTVTGFPPADLVQILSAKSAAQ
jgi:anaerobic ribonucleoside-triphosphate reductase activating protein